jgi:hypothetical protein
MLCSACPTGHNILERGGGQPWVRGRGGGGQGGDRLVIALTDHNFPAVLPSATGKCICIVRMELGTLEELGNLMLNLFSYLPAGTTILIGSLSQLRLGGLQSYTAACVKLGKKLAVKFGDAIQTLPFIPPLMGGTSHTNLIRYMANGSAWLGTLEDYPLHGYCAELEHLLDNAGREQEKGGGGPCHSL